jgi:hypothetical protein
MAGGNEDGNMNMTPEYTPSKLNEMNSNLMYLPGARMV